LCRRILFVTPSQSESWSFAAATTDSAPRLSDRTLEPIRLV
jgi:hypothetical protein